MGIHFVNESGMNIGRTGMSVHSDVEFESNVMRNICLVLLFRVLLTCARNPPRLLSISLKRGELENIKRVDERL